jgi:uncharacterized protein YjgD (DUF1641 family)
MIIHKLFIFLFIILLACTTNAKKVNINTVKLIAVNTYNRNIKGNSAKIIELLPDVKNKDTLFYIANFNDGFVIVSTEDAAPPIWAMGKRRSWKSLIYHLQ